MLKSYFKKGTIEAGCDEAGRGCLAGPVFAAAVILPPKYKNKMLDDSKKLNEKKRLLLREEILNDAIAWHIAAVSNEEIDEINILNASFLAMHRALDGLKMTPELLLIDGNRFKKYKSIPHECVIQGDGKFMSIAAASILAKTERDAFMEDIARQFPPYGWSVNKGYPTLKHRNAIRLHGITPYHRTTFRLLPLGEQLSLFE
ncbi:MAG: ribonuclease HII [Bacteroidetes bacterium]|nr:ribonuclease HII [Bacteroidota bacterium]